MDLLHPFTNLSNQFAFRPQFWEKRSAWCWSKKNQDPSRLETHAHAARLSGM